MTRSASPGSFAQLVCRVAAAAAGLGLMTHGTACSLDRHLIGQGPTQGASSPRAATDAAPSDAVTGPLDMTGPADVSPGDPAASVLVARPLMISGREAVRRLVVVLWDQ